MKTCPGCSSQLDDAATGCVFCGEKLSAETWETPVMTELAGPPRAKTALPLAFKLVLALGLAGLAYYAWSVNSLSAKVSGAASPAPATQEAATFKIGY